MIRQWWERWEMRRVCNRLRREFRYWGRFDLAAMTDEEFEESAKGIAEVMREVNRQLPTCEEFAENARRFHWFDDKEMEL